MSDILGKRDNPLLYTQAEPDWARLARLGGDGVAVLYADLRRRIGGIDDLVEEFHQHPQWGWSPRYRMGNEVLFSVHFQPGVLEAVFNLDLAQRARLLTATTLSEGIERAVREAPADEVAEIHWRLNHQADVRAFVRFMTLKSKLFPVGDR
jgi:hypothetical protein